MAQPNIGDDDIFSYMQKLKALLAPHGLFVEYQQDRAALDLGLHLYADTESGGTAAGRARVWMQVKGKRKETITAEQYEAMDVVKFDKLPAHLVRYWYAAPEAVYLVVYIESVDVFLARDVRELVDAAGGLAMIIPNQGQQTVTLNVPKTATLEHAIERMPRHRSMRIDGPTWRGRPLGHGYDPLRSELAPFERTDFVALIDALLGAHDFRVWARVDLGTADIGVPPFALLGRMTLSYEWVHPLSTEFGFGPNTDFRIEGAPHSVQGDVLVVVDPTGQLTPADVESRLAPLREEAATRGVRALLLFANGEHDPGTFGSWFADKRLACIPQELGSLTFNVLTTTMVYLEFLDRVRWNYVNIL
jgi:hypothetical protein